jgi:hypothetical protein
MARTTIDLDPVVLRQLKERQRREGKTLGQVASELLAQALEADVSAQRRVEMDWISKPMGDFIVDTDDKDALYEALDDEDFRR